MTTDELGQALAAVAKQSPRLFRRMTDSGTNNANAAWHIACQVDRVAAEHRRDRIADRLERLIDVAQIEGAPDPELIRIYANDIEELTR